EALPAGGARRRGVPDALPARGGYPGPRFGPRPYYPRPASPWPWIVGGLVLGIPVLLCCGGGGLFLVIAALTPPPLPPAPVRPPVPPAPFPPPGGPTAAGPATTESVVGLTAVAPDAGFPGALPWPALGLGGAGESLRLLPAAELDQALTDLKGGDPIKARDAA